VETSRDLHPSGSRPRHVAASRRFFVLAGSTRPVAASIL
jgi:hypothetical protein